MTGYVGGRAHVVDAAGGPDGKIAEALEQLTPEGDGVVAERLGPVSGPVEIGDGSGRDGPPDSAARPTRSRVGVMVLAFTFSGVRRNERWRV